MLVVTIADVGRLTNILALGCVSCPPVRRGSGNQTRQKQLINQPGSKMAGFYFLRGVSPFQRVTPRSTSHLTSLMYLPMGQAAVTDHRRCWSSPSPMLVA
jgi:hypothetical protein